MKRLAALAVAALALAGSAARAADPDIKFEKYKLKNGLTVILSEDHRLPQVAVDVWYHVGAANQAPGKSGFAHLFEHMMFSGSKHVQPSPFAKLEAIGVNGGSQANGSTNFDRTNYFEIVPSSELPTALWIESDRMAFLLDTLDDKKLNVQRDVVSNERRQRIENGPYGLAFQRVCDILYPAPHPYYECVIGSIPEIQAASMQDLRGFFREFYEPDNASLVLVGDFDPAQARKLVAQYFDAIPLAPKVKRPDLPAPKLDKVVHERVDDKIAQLPALDLVWPGVKMFDDDEAAGDVLAEILGGGKTSRLYKLLVFDKKVASSVSTGDAAMGLGGYFQIFAVANDGHASDELMPLVQGVLDDVKQNGVKIEEVERARRKIVAGMLRGIEGLVGKAETLNEFETYLGDPGYLPRNLSRYRAVTPEAVKAFANKYLPNDRRIELDIEPVAKKQASAQ